MVRTARQDKEGEVREDQRQEALHFHRGALQRFPRRVRDLPQLLSLPQI